MKKRFLFVNLIILFLYSGCAQNGNSLNENSATNTESRERGRIVEQKKVLIAKEQVNFIQTKPETTKSSNKNVNLVELVIFTGAYVAYSATSTNEVEAYEIQIETNSKIFKTYVNYDFSLGTMIDFTANANGTVTSITAKYLYK